MDPLSTVLRELNVMGTLYFQKSLTSPWSVNLHQDENVVRFHIVQAGQCYVRLHSSNESVLVEQGDIIFVSQGAPHTIYSDPTIEAESIELNELRNSRQFKLQEVVPPSSNAKGDHTQIVCGHYSFRDDGDLTFMTELPTLMHQKNENDEFNDWMRKTLSLCASKNNAPLPQSEIVIVKTAEIALTLAIRMHLDSADNNRIALNRSNKFIH